MANEYLKRTPTSTGNRKVWTWSGWIKRNKLSDWMRLFSTSNTSGQEGTIQLTNTNRFRFIDESSNPDYDYQTTTLLRDVGNWMHLMVSIDTTAILAEHRIKLYINGKNIIDNGLSTESAPGDVNEDLIINSITEHTLFARKNPSEYVVGGAFDIFLVDGQALTPDVFGFNKDGDGYISVGSTQATDFRPGQWSPHSPRKIKTEIERRGGFGVNGFYLPMNDSSNFGADFHTTPNSIITLKGEDLPQPRNGAPTTSDAYVSQLRSDPYAANLVLAVPGISTATSANLVSNGHFDTNTTGWTAGNSATLSVDSGRLKVTNGTSSAGYAYQEITVVIGQRYTVNLEGITGTSASNIRIGTAANSASYGNKIGSGLANISLTATSTSLYVTLKPNSNTNGNNAFFDNIVVKQEDAPRDYSADIKGSGSNKTLTPSGSAGVGYEIPSYYGSAMNFDGSGDYFEVANNDDFDFGSGDFTIEYWQNANSFSDNPGLGIWDSANNQRSWLIYNSSTNGRMRFYVSVDGSASVSINTSEPTIPTGQWIHFCMERNGSNLVGYVNGVCVGINTNLGTQSLFTPVDPLSIGSWSSNDLNGYIQDLRVYKGVAKYKGGFDVPKPYIPVGFEGESWRQVSDTCKNNFATLNGTSIPSKYTVSEGNLRFTNSTSNWTGFLEGTVGFSTGKWYWETRANVDTDYHHIGIVGVGITHFNASDSYFYGMSYQTDGRFWSEGNVGGAFATGKTHANDGDIVQVAVDMNDKKMWVGINGNWIDSGNPIAGTGENFNSTRGFNYQHYVPFYDSYGSSGLSINFGQNPTFGGKITAGTNTDDNGRGLFSYDVPTGFLALCEVNLPTPAIADPGEHFKTVLYTGDGNGGHSITGVGFKPDLVWIKCRSNADNHTLSDTVRGPGLALYSDLTNAEHASTIRIQSFNDDGFTTGSSGDTNTNGRTFCAWCWKAGGAAVANTDGSINSSVSANQTAGFSIVSYTGTGSAGTVGHGLGKRPEVVIVKRRDAATNWPMFVDGISNNTNDLLQLNLTNATATAGNFFNSGNTTTTTFPLGTGDGQTNASGSGHIAYCWAEIEGYSKFGSYKGNGNVDGPFVYCGFKPAWIMIKPYGSPSDSCYSSGYTSWSIYDSSRSPSNDDTMHQRVLFANRSYEEGKRGQGSSSGAFQNLDFLSNGFKIRGNSNCETNTTSIDGFFFMAFAESPFQTANAK